MKTTDFSFDLPEELIAQHPSASRGGSRLMVLDRRTGAIEHRSVADLPELLPPDTIMVFNDSRVRKARLYGRLGAGVEREFLLVRELPDDATGAASGSAWEAMTRKPRKISPGTQIAFPGNRTATVTGHREMFIYLVFEQPLDEDYFAAHGHVPLPPYIDRDDETEDEERYQTVYAREPGSVAAPTAGLHFTPELLSRLEEKGIEIEWVRLHVGIGTFLPVRVENVDDHEMHEEECELSLAAATRLNAARRNGRRLLAVGTTSVRTLESAWNRTTGELEPFRGATRLFIRPGYEFGAVDALFTNFHTPQSTLLMLVSAFAGRENVITAYETAVQERYRFFSYGDAMVILDRS
ncbi:MAG: tRNA preQ1(34) S-adenosylmethionine ribosyltransferase-isomerase QueA [Spirochaetota bacterium]